MVSSFDTGNPLGALTYSKSGNRIVVLLTLLTPGELEDATASVSLLLCASDGTVIQQNIERSEMMEQIDATAGLENIKVLIPFSQDGVSLSVRAIEQYVNSTSSDLGEQLLTIYGAPDAPSVAILNKGTQSNSSGNIVLSAHKLTVTLPLNTGGKELLKYSVIKKTILGGTVNTTIELANDGIGGVVNGAFTYDCANVTGAPGTKISYYVNVDNGVKDSALSLPAAEFLLSLAPAKPVLLSAPSALQKAGAPFTTLKVKIDPSVSELAKWTTAYAQVYVTGNWYNARSVAQSVVASQIALNGDYFFMDVATDGTAEFLAGTIYQVKVILGSALPPANSILKADESVSQILQFLPNMAQSDRTVAVTYAANVMTVASSAAVSTSVAGLAQIDLFKNDVLIGSVIKSVIANSAPTNDFPVTGTDQKSTDKFVGKISYFNYLSAAKALVYSDGPMLNGKQVLMMYDKSSPVFNMTPTDAEVPTIENMVVSSVTTSVSSFLVEFTSAAIVNSGYTVNSIKYEVKKGSADFTTPEYLKQPASGNSDLQYLTISGSDIIEQQIITLALGIGGVAIDASLATLYYIRAQVNYSNGANSYWVTCPFNTPEAALPAAVTLGAALGPNGTIVTSFAPTTTNAQYDGFPGGSDNSAIQKVVIQLMDENGLFVAQKEILAADLKLTESNKVPFVISAAQKDQNFTAKMYYVCQEKASPYRIINSEVQKSSQVFMGVPPKILSVVVTMSSGNYVITAQVDNGKATAGLYVLATLPNGNGGAAAGYIKLTQSGIGPWTATAPKTTNYPYEDPVKFVTIASSPYGMAYAPYPLL